MWVKFLYWLLGQQHEIVERTYSLPEIVPVEVCVKRRCKRCDHRD